MPVLSVWAEGSSPWVDAEMSICMYLHSDGHKSGTVTPKGYSEGQLRVPVQGLTALHGSGYSDNIAEDEEC